MAAHKRRNRRNDLVEAALDAFGRRGYDGTSVADIVEVLGMSKAAFGYHVGTKEQLLIEIVEPFLNELEAVLAEFPRHPSWPEPGRSLLGAYLDVLIRNRYLVTWIDGDKAVLEHPLLGKRLADVNARVRVAIRGDNRSVGARIGASAALGALWRPVRNLTDSGLDDQKDAMLSAAMAVVGTVRAS